MPKRPERHRIDAAAQKHLTNALPDEWVIRPQNPDYGVDYLVEPFNADEASGLQIGVQLKGKKNVQISSGRAKCKGIKTDHLAYYLERDDPIFLVLVDTVKRAGWYVFLQRYTLEDLAGENWRGQKTITVCVPIANDITNVDRFEADAWEARKFMTALRPGALEASVAAQQGLMESKDPRFKVLVKAAEGRFITSCRRGRLSSSLSNSKATRRE